MCEVSLVEICGDEVSAGFLWRSAQESLDTLGQSFDRDAVQRLGTDHNFEAVVFGRVVTPSDHHGGARAHVLLGEVGYWGGDDTNVDDIGGDAETCCEGLEEAGGVEAAVSPDHDGSAGGCLRADRDSECPYDVVREIAVGVSPDVVFPKNMMVHEARSIRAALIQGPVASRR
jgi:hypothetical protein